jgi:hypothetical protein
MCTVLFLRLYGVLMVYPSHWASSLVHEGFMIIKLVTILAKPKLEKRI